MDNNAYLIVDIGTGNARVAIMGANGSLLGVDRADMVYHTDNRYPNAQYFEPKHLWETVCRLADNALQQAGDVNILAITSTSQREGIVVLNESGEAVIGLPNIDHRGREWESMVSDPHKVYELTGRYPTSLFSVMKLVGIRERDVDTWQQIYSFTSISDWVTYMLSGVLVYEHSQASETLLYNVAKGSWDDDLCSIYGIDKKLLPKLAQSGTALGQITANAATQLKISTAAKIIVGGADTQLAVVSTFPEVDDIVIVSGTTTPIIKLTGNYLLDKEMRTWTGRHTNSDVFMFETNAGVTGLNYQRLKEIFYPNEGYEVIEKELAEMEDCKCVAALGSLLADEKKPLLKGGFIFDVPVSHKLSRAVFVQALLWDVACSIFENYKTLVSVDDHKKDYLWACGGGLQSLTLRRYLAGLTNKKIRMRASYDRSSVIGGAIICNDHFSKETSGLDNMEEVEPDNREDYQLLYNQWKGTREQLKKGFNS